MNLTDVDDKTIHGARESGTSLAAFTNGHAEHFFTDIARLNIEPAEHYPRATEHIPEMIALIERLITAGHAYVAEGSVYFAIRSFPRYGTLSRIDLAGRKPGARVETDEYAKEAAEDFVLWKGAKPYDEAVGATWESPWGRGRPGWHIECSAMSMNYLGETFDLHAGGVDLLFPHHEDEVAQSEGATGQSFARFFLEAEHLLVNGQKMAKSLGNFLTLAEILGRGIDPLAFRYLCLSAHYRSKLNFTWDSLAAAASALARLRESQYRPDRPVDEDAIAEVEAALANDVDTPRVLALLQTADNPALWRRYDDVLGLGLVVSQKAPIEVTNLVAEREAARKRRNFVHADLIRNQISIYGWEVEDTPTGPRVIRVADRSS